jgi:hypothetical protein
VSEGPSGLRGAATDEEMLRNSERATETIMEVFDDPIFRQEGQAMELEEIDF